MNGIEEVLAARRADAAALPDVIAKPEHYGLQTLEVDTTDGFDPSLEAAASFVLSLGAV